MTRSNYDPEWVANYFDDFGIGEWERMVAEPIDEVALYIHTYYLQHYTPAGARVLEVGAGAGRFTQVLADAGASMVVADISPGQLALNRKHAHELGFATAVEAWHELDMCDMSRFTDGSFDCVVAYGGPLSYVLDQRATAVAECVRVLKPGGVLLAGVISMWGAAHQKLREVLALAPQANQPITASGDVLPGSFPQARHFMHMYRPAEFRHLLQNAGLQILALSASQCLSLGWEALLVDIRADEARWQELLRMELEACADEGALGMGPHLIAVAQKTA